MNLTPKNYQKNLLALSCCTASTDYFLCLGFHLWLFDLRPKIWMQGEGRPRDGKLSINNKMGYYIPMDFPT